MIQKVFEKLVLSKRRELPFIIFFSFLVTFAVSRLVVYSIQNDLMLGDVWFVDYLFINGVHIHHFNYGILLLAISGLWALLDEKRNHLYVMAILYGMGLGLIMDEFGILVTLDEAYWVRLSYDAVIITSLVFLNIIYFKSFWGRVGKILFKRKKEVSGRKD